MIFFIVFIAIFIPYIAPPEKRLAALYISLLLLFIPWGLQYEMTQDWEPHLIHWNVVNNGASLIYESKELEPVYVFWLELLSPFTYFGYLMICAILELSIIGYCIKKFVNPDYYWVSIAVLMLCVQNGLLMINSNRMTMALMLIIVGVLFLFKNDGYESFEDIDEKGIKWNRLLLFLVMIFIAINIHSGAIAAAGLLLIYIASKKLVYLNTFGWIAAMNVIFMLRFFVDVSSLQLFGLMYLESFGVEDFEEYIDEIENAENVSKVYTPILFVFLNVILLTFHKMTSVMKFFALAFIIHIQFTTYMIGAIGRVLQYYYIYSIFLVPYLVSLTKTYEWEIVRKVCCVLFFLLIVYDFIKYVTTDFCYERWTDFHTIFEAPYWM